MFEQYISAARSENVCMDAIYLLFTIFIPMKNLLSCLPKKIFLQDFEQNCVLSKSFR